MSLKALRDAKIKFGTYTTWIDNPETKDGFPRIQKDTGFVTSVRMPWTPEEWIQTIRGLAGCCGNLSEVRSVLLGAFAGEDVDWDDGGWLDIKELSTCALTLREHEGWDKKDLKTPAPDHKDPLARLIWIWDQVKRKVHAFDQPSKLDPQKPEDAVVIIGRGCSMLWMNDVINSGEFDPSHYTDQSPEALEKKRKEHHENRFENNLGRTLAFARVYPALKTLYEKIQSLAPAPADAFAILRKGETAPVETRGGLAIYGSIEHCREIMGYWNDAQENVEKVRKAEGDKREGLTVFEIHKCRVDVQNGLVIGELVEQAAGPG